MDVKIKKFDVDMAIKTKGIEVEVKDGDEHLGDLYITKAKVIWCKGRTTRKNGIGLSWRKFVEFMDTIDS